MQDHETHRRELCIAKGFRRDKMERLGFWMVSRRKPSPARSLHAIRDDVRDIDVCLSVCNLWSSTWWTQG